MSLDIAKHGVPSWPTPRQIHLMIMWNDVESNPQHFVGTNLAPLDEVVVIVENVNKWILENI
jgi:hypothetical protein